MNTRRKLFFFGKRGGAPAPTFDPDYQAVLNYATAQSYTLPSAAQQTAQNQLVLDLKAAGVWAKLDSLGVFATDGNDDFALIDWKRLTSMTAVNAPAFTTNQGFTGDGASAHINSGYNLLNDSTNYTLTDACIGGYFNIIDVPLDDYIIMGGVDNDINASQIGRIGGDERALMNALNSSTPRFSINFAAGHFMAYTNASVDVGLINNATNETKTDDRVVIPNSVLGYLGRVSQSGSIFANTNWTMSIGYAGADLSGLRTPFFAAIDTYMGAI